MVDEIFDKKQNDEKLKNLINSFLKTDNNSLPATDNDGTVNAEENIAIKNDLNFNTHEILKTNPENSKTLKDTSAKNINPTNKANAFLNENNLKNKTPENENDTISKKTADNINENDTNFAIDKTEPLKNLDNDFSNLDENNYSDNFVKNDLAENSENTSDEDKNALDEESDFDEDDDEENEDDTDDDTDDDEVAELSEEEKLLLAKENLDNKYNTIKANLLGEFDADGIYRINNFIMAELLSMPKILKRSADGEMELVAEYKDGTLFSFTVTKPQLLENGDAIANLVLNEKIEYLSEKPLQMLSTIVGSYCYKYSNDFDVKLMLVFNIYKPDDPGAKARTPTDYIGLKIEYNNAVALAGKDLFDKLEETYFNKHIQIINSLKNSTLFLSIFNEKRKALEKKFGNNMKGKFRALNELLKDLLNSPLGADIVKSEEYKSAKLNLDTKYLETAKKIGGVILENDKVKQLKQKRADEENKEFGIYITELLKNRGDHGPIIAGAIKEAKKQEAKKAEAKKAAKAAGNSKSGGGKKGGGKKGGGKKKKPKGKKDDKKKMALAPAPKNKETTKPQQQKSAEERYKDSREQKPKTAGRHMLINTLQSDTAKTTERTRTL